MNSSSRDSQKKDMEKKGETTRLLLAFKYLNNDFFSSMEAARVISKESFSLMRLRKEKFSVPFQKLERKSSYEISFSDPNRHF